MDDHLHESQDEGLLAALVAGKELGEKLLSRVGYRHDGPGGSAPASRLIPAGAPHARWSGRFEKVRLLDWQQERMTYQEVSQWLRRSRATLHRWIHEGKLTPLPEYQRKSR